MIQTEYNTKIKRPIEEVFERLVNINDYPNWLPKSRVFLFCEQKSEGPTDMDSTFIDKTRIGVYQGEVTDFKRPRRVRFRMRLNWFGRKVMESRPGYVLKSVNGGTEVQHKAEGELFGLFKLMEPYVALRARQERKRIVDMLKESLES